MTTTATPNTADTPLSDYFVNMDPLLGGTNDPFAAWDADLHPEEYGDQSGYAQSSWEEDHASFSDDDAHSLSSCGEDDDDDDWNIVYAASFTVVASTTGSPKRRSSMTTATTATSSSTASLEQAAAPPLPPPATITRRDSKVRFSEQPPQVNCYETCSRDQYSELWFSVHELQKNICELRLESNGTTGDANGKGTAAQAPAHGSNATLATSAATPTRSA